jgi:hypothetical protein
MIPHPYHCALYILHGCWKRVCRSQSIIDRDDHIPLEYQFPGNAGMGLLITTLPATSMYGDHGRILFSPLRKIHITGEFNTIHCCIYNIGYGCRSI